MIEPTRLLSTPESELERALLNAGRSYSASDSTRAKTLLALGLSGAATTSASSAAAASTSLTKAVPSKVAIAMIVLGVAALPIWRYLHPPAVSIPLALAPVASKVPVLPATALVEPGPSETARVEARELPPSSAVASVSTSHAEPKPASAPPLAAELAALDAARTSLSHSDPGAALLALDGYARTFPHGKLRMEAEVLRIGALATSGQTDAARKHAEAFLHRHPDSVLASRVRSYAGL